MIIALIVAPAPANASPQLGTATVFPDSTACILLNGPAVRPGERIYVLLLPARVTDAVIVAKLSQACDSSMIAPGTPYLARLRFALDDVGRAAGVAVYDRTARVVYEDGEIVFHTKDAASPLRFRQCYSSEGEHFSAWRGNRRTWHAYHYLGFDLEANCTEEEVAD